MLQSTGLQSRLGLKQLSTNRCINVLISDTDSCKVLTLAPDSEKDLCTVDLRSPDSTNSSVTFFLQKSYCYYLFIHLLSAKD